MSSTPKVRNEILANIAKTDWKALVAPLGKPAQDAFRARLADVVTALKANTIEALVKTRNKRKP
jgi:hypothetical protein